MGERKIMVIVSWSNLLLLISAIPLLVSIVWHWNDAFFSVSLWLRLRKNDKNGRIGKLPPGHMGIPFFGETLTFLWYFKILRRPDDFIKHKKKKYGDVGIYRSYIFGHPTIITCSPATNKFVLHSADDFSGRWPSLDLVGHNSIVSVEGRQHKRLRSFVVNAVNHPNALRWIAEMVQPRIVSTLRSWESKGMINASIETKKVTFENICKMFMSMEPGPLLDEIDLCFSGLLKGLRSNTLDLPGTAFRKALNCRKRLNALFMEELNKRKQGEDRTDDKGNDLMFGLMQIRDDEGNRLSDDEVVDNAISVVIAGYESTSLSAMWALYHLSKSPEALKKLREENFALSMGKKDGFITMDDISKLKYTAKVVEETIRMANVALTAFRVANKDVYYNGFLIPEGWQVAIWLRSIHTDPQNFEDPLSFKPERWDEPRTAKSFQVFGGGPRICAGNMLARIQLTILLHHLALGYSWKLINPDAKINYLPHPRPEDGALMEFSKI